jgi:hypothetical protein
MVKNKLQKSRVFVISTGGLIEKERGILRFIRNKVESRIE